MSTTAIPENQRQDVRKATDSLGEVDVFGDKLWGAQVRRSLAVLVVHEIIVEDELESSAA